MKRILHLDDFRAILCLAVLYIHANLPWFGSAFMELGGLAVKMFMVLSGFFITGILLNRPSLRSFLISRSARIFPAYYLCLLLSVPFFGEWPTLATFLYGSNYFSTNPQFCHTWSLSVEEQFYLVWPILLLFVAKNADDVRKICFATFIVSAILSAATWWSYGDSSKGILYVETQYNALLFAFGGILATTKNWKVILIPILVGLAATVTFLQNVAIHQSAHLIACSISCVVVWVAIRFTFPSFLILRKIGEMSYGLYLFHVPIFRLVDMSDWTGTALAVSLTFAVAALSFYYFERPLSNKIKKMLT